MPGDTLGCASHDDFKELRKFITRRLASEAGMEEPDVNPSDKWPG